MKVVTAEGQPALSSVATAPNSSQVSGYASFRDDEAELQKLAVDFGGAPAYILFRQASDEATNLLGDLRPAAPRAGPPAPVEAKPGSAPARDGCGLHDNEDVGPAGPKLSQSGPEEPVQPIQAGPRPFTFEHGDLLSEGEDFEGGVAPMAEEDAESGQN